ncbi:MAG: hypothetical protein C4K49_10905 [Candidatus Thorarchaeota archaeon]|nr:MAG: hypothetical protein C4K49_10905 [Candidatus Thorarchaeota archaeon]
MRIGRPPQVQSGSGNIRLVKGCPCYKEFGDEKVCLNNDDVRPINCISLDPSFFTQMDSRDRLSELKSNNESMCYLLIGLDDEDGRVYCVSQNERLMINNRDVRASDIDDALQFVSTKEMSTDGAVCSSCLYKYLITLSNVFSDMLTDSERSDVIRAYVRQSALKIAMGLESAPEEEELKDEQTFRNHIKKRIDELMKQRAELASLIDGLKQSGENEEVVKLCEYYRALTRLQAVFLYQVLTLGEANEEHIALGLLKFMVEVADRVVETSNMVRQKSHELREAGAVPESVQLILQKHDIARKRIEQRFLNLARVLSQV